MTGSERWWGKAEYDLGAARDMLNAGRCDYVVFCCQQAVEKALKALIVERSGELPPRIHNLTDLAQIAGVVADAKRAELMLSLTNLYVQSRYPGVPEGASEESDRRTAEALLRNTEDMLQWLSTLKKT